MQQSISKHGFSKLCLTVPLIGGLLTETPLSNMTLLDEGPKRDVGITIDDAIGLIDSLPYPVDCIVELAMLTGLRKENILGLTINSIRFYDTAPGGEIRLYVKGNKLLRHPINEEAVGLLKRIIGDRTGGYVFLSPKTGTRYKSINRTFDIHVRKANLTALDGSKLRIHDLRHVYATWLAEAGVSLDNIRHLLGHSDRKTTDRYVTVNQKHISQSLDLMPKLRKKDA